jgi:hypothetical protein
MRTYLCKSKIPIGVMLVSMLWAGALPAAESADGNITADDIVQHCYFKYPGDDQRSQLTILLRDKGGNEKKTVYKRYWKDYKGKDGFADKMVLFTLYPPDAEHVGFLRWSYPAATDKNPDQWVYLPVLRKMRRVSVRDPADSFLGSDLTHFDIAGHQLDGSDNQIMRTVRQGNDLLIEVRSVPRDKDKAIYGGYITLFDKGPGTDWDNCLMREMQYYDKHGDLLKKEVFKWQKIGKAWVWDTVSVANIQSGHSSLFNIADVQINVGLQDETFTERNLKEGR